MIFFVNGQSSQAYCHWNSLGQIYYCHCVWSNDIQKHKFHNKELFSNRIIFDQSMVMICLFIYNNFKLILNNLHILIYSIIFWVYLKVPPGGEYAKQRVLGSSCLSIIERIVAVPAPSEWPTHTRSKFWVPLSVSLLKARVKRCSSFNFL